MTPARFLGFACAIAVHGLTLAIALAGLALLALPSMGGPARCAGLLCLLVAWFVHPRMEKPTSKGWPRERIPTLYALADKIAHELHAPCVERIVITSTANASYAQVGWRRTRVLSLGLPLLAVLNEREKVAVIAHELAHAVNGDAARGIIVGSAISSLARWYKVFYPLRVTLSLGFTELIYLYVLMLNHLLWRDRQRAEYLADHLSARVTGTDATLSALHMLHCANTCAVALRDARLIQDVAEGKIEQLFEELRQRIAHLPERERERVRRIEQLETFRLDATHPPTVHRVALLQGRPVLAPAIALSPEESDTLARELALMEQTAQARIAGAYKPKGND